ncbi:hypothetical protein RHSIM_Rhsim04G0226500 [Rhododendron simsii]|uniref:Uncharacterized protein n=1 Tax=Rhododendron simsii TaxID=118357 RepID=A0A834GZM0_RHOSS|nr:hypothetical protein RHSIM_Rhsim04G0226500 [Rhododendron simsii]
MEIQLPHSFCHLAQRGSMFANVFWWRYMLYGVLRLHNKCYCVDGDFAKENIVMVEVPWNDKFQSVKNQYQPLVLLFTRPEMSPGLPIQMFVVALPLPYNYDENLQQNKDLVRIGMEGFDILDKKNQQQLRLPADQEVKHYGQVNVNMSATRVSDFYDLEMVKSNDNKRNMRTQGLVRGSGNLWPGEKMQRVKFPMARQADLVKIGKEAFDALDKMLQRQRQQPLPADKEAKHYELPNALMTRQPKPQKNCDIGAQSTAAVVIKETENKGIPIFGK